MRCEDVMTREVATVPPQASVRTAATMMREFNIGFLPVSPEDGSVEGIVTDRDLAMRVVAEGLSDQTSVRDIMTDVVVACRPSDDVRRAEDLMRAHQIERVLCVDDSGQLAGVISLTDLSQYESEQRAGTLLADIRGREADVH